MESDYCKELSANDKKLYAEKLTLANGKTLPDPFTIFDWWDDMTLLPDISHVDLFRYLVDTPSQFTMESLKAYKSLEAYNFLSGHVQDVLLLHKIISIT